MDMNMKYVYMKLVFQSLRIENQAEVLRVLRFMIKNNWEHEQLEVSWVFQNVKKEMAKEKTKTAAANQFLKKLHFVFLKSD